jgi:hypothetical protein
VCRFELPVERLALLGQPAAALGQLVQADHLGLIGVEQALVGSRQALEAGAQFMLGCRLAGSLLIGRHGEVLELGEQSLRIAE